MLGSEKPKKKIRCDQRNQKFLVEEHSARER
ncbi:unnamed protein product [Victoria cruziana]